MMILRTSIIILGSSQLIWECILLVIFVDPCKKKCVNTSPYASYQSYGFKTTHIWHHRNWISSAAQLGSAVSILLFSLYRAVDLWFNALGNPKMKTYILLPSDIPIMCCLIIPSFCSLLTPYRWGPGQLWSIAITRTFYAHQWECWLRSSAVSAASAAAFKTLAVNFSSTVIHSCVHDRLVKRFTTTS